MQIETFAFYFASLLLFVGRYLKTLSPLFGLIPSRWQWLPPTLTAATGTASLLLPGVAGWGDAINLLLAVGVVVAVGAGKGHGQASPSPPDAGATSPLPGALVGLAVLLTSAGCSPSLPAAGAEGRAARIEGVGVGCAAALDAAAATVRAGGGDPATSPEILASQAACVAAVGAL